MAKLSKYIKQNSHKIVCPPCQGKAKPEKMAPHIAQAICLCGKCNQVWIYRADISESIIKRRVMWWYSKRNND